VSATAEPIGTVTWEEWPGKSREVKGFCERCQRSVSQGNHTRRMKDFSDVQIVSPSGIAHAQHEDGDERTACGLNAAKLDWWWRL
jgi:hypothetical protein